MAREIVVVINTCRSAIDGADICKCGMECRVSVRNILDEKGHPQLVGHGNAIQVLH